MGSRKLVGLTLIDVISYILRVRVRDDCSGKRDDSIDALSLTKMEKV